MPLINFAGLASGIDSNALIDAVNEAARAQRVKPLEDQVTKLEETNDAFSEVKTKTTSFRDLLAQYTSALGGVLTKQVTSSDETVASGVATSEATNGSYSVTVTQLARNANGSFADVITDTESAVVPSLNVEPSPVTITVGTGTDQVSAVISVFSSTTWNELVTEINTDESLQNRAVASLVNVGTASSPSYRLMITTLDTGTAKGTLNVSVSSDITSEGSLTSFSTSQALNAEVTVSGIAGTISRDTNDINIIPGLTIKAQKTGSATLTVGNDVSATTAKVREIVESYNELITYINENDIISREENGEEVKNIFGALASTSIDENLITTIRNSLSNSTYESGSQVRIYADLGIQTQRDGTFLFKEDIFATAMAEEPSSVNEIIKNFADDAGTFSGSVAQFIQFNGLIDLAVRGNEDEIKSLNDKIDTAERAIEQQAAILRQRFARLESTIGRYNSQASALSSALAGLGG